MERGWGGWALAQGAEDVGFSPGHCPGCKQEEAAAHPGPPHPDTFEVNKINNFLNLSLNMLVWKLVSEPGSLSDIMLFVLFYPNQYPQYLITNWLILSMLLIVLAKFTDKIFPSFTNNYLGHAM